MKIRISFAMNAHANMEFDSSFHSVLRIHTNKQENIHPRIIYMNINCTTRTTTNAMAWCKWGRRLFVIVHKRDGLGEEDVRVSGGFDVQCWKHGNFKLSSLLASIMYWKLFSSSNDDNRLNECIKLFAFGLQFPVQNTIHYKCIHHCNTNKYTSLKAIFTFICKVM